MDFHAVEMSKMSDKMKETFGFELDQYMIAYRDMELEKDKTVISFTTLAKAQKESEAKQQFEKATPAKEVIDELIERGNALGNPQYKQDGTMTFDYFLATMKVVTEFTIRHT